MQTKKLGETSLEVTKICLGTMTWGVQNTAEEAAQQLDMALDYGVNFLDTAEMYPVPPSADKTGLTEEYIGRWIKTTGKRDQYIIATKMAGPGRTIRGGRGLVAADVEEAVDASLQRLGIDCIDLYQLHWPQRQVNCFAQRDFQPDKHTSLSGEDMLGMLEALGRMIEAGKIRYIGLSNETPWGVMRYLQLAKEHGLPRMATVQNPYSLLQRNWDVHMGEVAMRENIPLLAYSPLAGGALSGKYLDGARPDGARFSTWGKDVMSRHYANIDSDIMRAYVDLAQDHGLTPTQMALAFVNDRAHMGSNIIGATSTEQLKECLSSAEITLSEECLNAIEVLHDAHPSPSLSRGGPRDAG